MAAKRIPPSGVDRPLRIKLKLSSPTVTARSSVEAPGSQVPPFTGTNDLATSMAGHLRRSFTESALGPVPAPAIRSRVLSESEISILDLGPSLASTPGLPGDGFHQAPRVAMDSSGVRISPHAVIRLRARSRFSFAGIGNLEMLNQPVRINGLDLMTLNSDSVPINSDCPLALRPPPQEEMPNIPYLGLPDNSVPLSGDIHLIGYGYGFDGYSRSHFFIPEDPDFEAFQLPGDPTWLMHVPNPRVWGSRNGLSNDDFFSMRDGEIAMNEHGVPLFPRRDS